MIRSWLFALCLLFIAPACWALPVEIVTSAGGIRAWLITDKSTPIVALHFAFRGGVEQDPKEQQGLSSLMADMLTEGAGQRDAAAYQRALAQHGVNFGLQAGRDVISGQLYALKSAMPVAVNLAREALLQPRFDAEALARIKQKYFAAIKGRLADPEWQGRRALLATMLGDHPYSLRSLGTMASIKAMGSDALRLEQQRRLAKDNLIIAVAGDVTAQELRPWLDRIFADLPAKAQLRLIPDAVAESQGKTLNLPFAAGQSVMLFAAPAIKRNDPDWHAASLLNYILGGGGFESRLLRAVRDQRGLTYGIDTSLAPMEAVGLLLGETRVPNASAAEAWQITRQVWEELWQDGVTAEELEAAKAYALGSLPTTLTSSNAVAALLLGWQRDGLPPTYDQERKGLLSAVTLADMQRVARRLLDPQALSLVLVGNPPDFTYDLEGQWQND
jgi:zinc protease